jgi:hypothetical protein
MDLRLCFFSLIVLLIPSVLSAQSNFLNSHDLPQVMTPVPGITSESSQACAINNLQGPLASGTLEIFAVPGQGFATLFDPSGTGGAGDPGCFVSEPYPFQINTVNLNMFSAGGFNVPPANGVGTFEYLIRIWSSVEDVEGCAAPGDILFSSPTQTVVITAAANQYPQSVGIDFEVDGPFFVLVEAVSWSGDPAFSPSAVLWGNVALPACRQYVLLFNAEGQLTAPDMTAVFMTSGWTNVVVNGDTPDAAGDIDIAVSNVTANPELVQSIPAAVSATVSNLGEVDVAGIEVVLSANGLTVFTSNINLASGASTEVDFIYTPGVLGDVELVVSTDVDGDIDIDNNSASFTVTVTPPADPCIFSDDIEGYDLGGIVAQSDQWVTWTPGAANQDGEVTTEQAFSGTQSVKIAGAPEDLNYLLGNQASGTWRIAFQVYVPEGNGTYWNIQKSQTAGLEWAMQMFLNADGSASIDAGGVNAASFSHDQGVWNEVEMIVNLDANVANLYFAGDWIFQWTYSWSATDQVAGLIQIGAINFYPFAADNPLMYVDDVNFCQWPNNSPCQAFDLVAGQAIQGDNTGATPWNPSLADEAACWLEEVNTIDNDVWYTFTVPADGSYNLSTDLEVLENIDTQILVYTSSDDTCEGELTQIGCGEDVDANNFLSQVLLTNLAEGTVLWILVDGYDGLVGTFQIGIFPLEGIENDVCEEAADLADLLGGDLLDPQVSDVYSNVGATATDAVDVPACFDDETVDNTLWFTFEGDGNSYYITTNDCGGGIDYVPFGDTQIAVYTGACDDLTEVACSENVDFDNDLFMAGFTFATTVGETYYVMVDTWGGGLGEFCLSMENLGEPDNTESAQAAQWTMYPNPATDAVRLKAAQNMEHVLVINSVGQLVKRIDASIANEIIFDIAALAKGLYFVQITMDGQVYTKKLTVQ